MLFQVYTAAGGRVGEMGGRDIHFAGNAVVEAQEGIDVVRGYLAGRYCLDDRGRTGDRIPAGEDVA